MNSLKKSFFFCFLFCFFFLPSSALFAEIFEDQFKKASLLIDKDQYQEALVLLEEILNKNFEMGGHLKSRILNNLGYCYYKLNNSEKAMDFYHKALELDSQYAVCLNNCAAVLMNQKKYGEALPYLDRAYLLDKAKIKVIFNLFVVHYFLNNENDALLYLKEAFRLDADYTEKRLKKNNIDKKKIEKLKRYLENK